MPTEGPAEANSASQTASSQIQIDVLDNGGQLTCNSGRTRGVPMSTEKMRSSLDKVNPIWASGMFRDVPESQQLLFSRIEMMVLDFCSLLYFVRSTFEETL